MTLRPRSSRLSQLFVLAVGLMAGVGLAAASGASRRDTLDMVLMAAGASLAVAVISLALLRRLGDRSLVVQILVVTLAAVSTSIAGVVLAAELMFISTHDLGVLGVVMMVSVAIAVAAGLEFSIMTRRRIDEVERLIADLTIDSGVVGTGICEAAADGGGASARTGNELEHLAQRLVETSSALGAVRRRERALEAARRELVASVSHDLRSPIASIRAMAEALEDHVVDDSDDVSRFHTAIRLESQRLGSLVDDLFELSRIESGVSSADTTMVGVDELIAEVTESSQPAAAAVGINLVCMFGVGVDRGSSGLVPAADLRRVLHNLLDNAIRHTRTGGSVVVDGEVVDGVLTLSVTDECGGIPGDDLPRVFEVAFRGDAARSRDARGGGLGLAIAKGLVESRQGHIDVANRGRGCRFTLSVPVVRP